MADNNMTLKETENNEKASAQETINDTKNAVKDGASLAKNASTGNVVGAAKDVANLMKNKTVKKKMKKKIILNAIPYIAIVLISLIAASAILTIFTKLIETIAGTIQSIGDSIVSFFVGENTSFEIDDDKLDELIKAIEDTGVDIEDLELLRRYRL